MEKDSKVRVSCKGNYVEKRHHMNDPYRVTLVVAYLGWVDPYLYVLPSCICKTPLCQA